METADMPSTQANCWSPRRRSSRLALQDLSDAARTGCGVIANFIDGGAGKQSTAPSVTGGEGYGVGADLSAMATSAPSSPEQK